MSEIEDEIRRQMLAERAAQNPTPSQTVPYLPAPGVQGASLPPGSSAPLLPPAATSGKHQGAQRKGLAGALTAIGVAIAKFWALILSVLLKLKGLLVAFKLLTFAKVLLTGGTMLISVIYRSFLFGWPAAIGMVLLIFIHECGHALAARRLGHPVGMMVFLPGMGAFVTTRGCRNAVEDAYVGIMGPVVGTAAGLLCILIFAITRNPLWMVLAHWAFVINLLNLAPSVPLDGGWIVPLFSPKILLPGVILLFLIFWRNPLVWVLGFLSIPRIITAWKSTPDDPYFRATTQQRWNYGLAYAGIVVLLATAMALSNHYTLNILRIAI